MTLCREKPVTFPNANATLTLSRLDQQRHFNRTQRGVTCSVLLEVCECVSVHRCVLERMQMCESEHEGEKVSE